LLKNKTKPIIWGIIILQLSLVFFTSDIFAQQESQKPEPPWWKEIWSKNFFIWLLLLFLFTLATYFLSLVRKDKLLKKLGDKYVVFDMGEGKRIGGIMRWAPEGMEIISEESRKRGGAPSFVFNQQEREQIKAYIRYLDAMNERERVERDSELEHVYHPSFPAIVLRRIRNFFVALKTALNQAVERIWGAVQKSRIMRSLQTYKMGEETEAVKKEAWQQASEESYERLIERFVGSKIKVKAHNSDYIGILKDYTKEHLYLMDVRTPNGQGYMDQWKNEIDIEHGKRKASDDRGVHMRIEGDILIVENYESYPIQIHGVRYKGDIGDPLDDWKWGRTIEPFGEIRAKLRSFSKNVNVGPLIRVVTRQTINWWQFKRIELEFRSFRVADILFPRRYTHITETAEKYQPKLLSLTKIMETDIEEEEKEELEEFLITDKEGQPIKGLSIVHGYVTNINEDRIDIKSVDQLYARRWSVEHAFNVLDDKLRPIKTLVKINPIYRSLVAKQTALVKKIGDAQQANRPIAPILYSPARHNIQLPDKEPPVLPIKVLALTGNITDEEFPVIKQHEQIRGHRLIFDQTKDPNLPNIERTHILWVGQGELFNKEYRMKIDGEKRIKTFVNKGGIVIVSGQNVEDLRRINIGWIPERVFLSELNETTEFNPVRFSFDARQIFGKPNKIESGEVKLDDSWTEWSNNFEVLATMNGGGEAAVLMLKYGKGIYILTGFKNEKPEDVQTNAKVIENLLHYSVRFFDKQDRQHLYAA